MKNLKEEIKKEVELLAIHEETVGYLYERFSYRFPKENLWIKLSQDETAHAKIIRGLFEEIKTGNIVASPDVFPVKKLVNSTARLEKIAKNVKRYSMEDALELAYKIESDILESGYFKMFYPVSVEFKKVFSYLSKAADLHSQKIYIKLKG